MIPARRPRRARLVDAGEATFVGELLRREQVGGAIALAAAAVALVWANLAPASYDALRHLPVGRLDLEHWAADGALALFFYLAGLELKRELLVGSLRRPADAAVPVVAAACGVLVPAALYVLVARAAGAPAGSLAGWAIPSATDIAFALAVLAVAGRRLPAQLRTFLLTLAVVDDLLVIVVIALFYSGSLDAGWLVGAVAGAALFAALQAARVRSGWVYLPLAAGTWWCTAEAGVHATVAGVVLGLLTRVRPDLGEVRSPAERLEHRLTPLSAGVAVPAFALLTAGVPLTGAGLLSPVALAVATGLVVGKPLGVLGGTWLLTRFTRAELDGGIDLRDVAGVAVLAGVGFTVSLLVSDLAFADVRQQQAKAAVLAGSLVSAVLAALVLGRRGRVHARAA